MALENPVLNSTSFQRASENVRQPSGTAMTTRATYLITAGLLVLLFGAAALGLLALLRTENR